MIAHMSILLNPLPTAQPEPRSAEILDSIKGAFAAKGFEGASMQDLARAAGMSAGNFYRYFPSKDAIVTALVERDLAEVQREFTQIINSPTPHDTFRTLVRARVERPDPGKEVIFAQIEALAARRPEIAALKVRMEQEILGYLVAAFARIADVSQPEAARRFTAHAKLVMLLIRGLSSCCCTAAGSPEAAPDPALAELVMAALDRTLADVAAAGAALTEISLSPLAKKA